MNESFDTMAHMNIYLYSFVYENHCTENVPVLSLINISLHPYMPSVQSGVNINSRIDTLNITSDVNTIS